MLLLGSVTAGAVTEEDYPLRVFVVQTHFNRTQHLVNGNLQNQFITGEGHGNIQEGNSVTGFDYTFSCSGLYPTASTGDPFNPSSGGYRGRWKKQGMRLAVLLVEIGNPKHHGECELKTKLVDVVYSISQGQLVGNTRQRYDEAMAWRKASAAATHPADTDPAHFPLKVVILEAQWQNHPGGGFMGEGLGNLQNGDSVVAFTFNAPRCAGRLSAVDVSNIYQGKWVEEPRRLLVLAHIMGASSGTGFAQCEIETKVQPNNVLVKNVANGVIQTLTQDQNRARLQAAQTTQQSSAGTKAEARPGASSSQKLSVASNPDGADIEVDGAFVGSTPSVVELSQGEHSVVIRKPGYKPWERKLRLGGGDIKLNADLEKP
jgi:hypothetical protein